MNEQVIYWNTHTGRTYSVYSTTNIMLATWPTSPVYQVFGDSGSKSYTNSDLFDERFFRVGVSTN